MFSWFDVEGNLLFDHLERDVFSWFQLILFSLCLSTLAIKLLIETNFLFSPNY